MYKRQSECGAHVVSANQCGAADSVVFAGNSTVTAPNGSLMHASPIDEEDLFVFDTAPGAVDVGKLGVGFEMAVEEHGDVAVRELDDGHDVAFEQLGRTE